MKKNLLSALFVLLTFVLITGCTGNDISGTYQGDIDGQVFILTVEKADDGYDFALAPEMMKDQPFTFNLKAESSKVYTHAIEGDAFTMTFDADKVTFMIPELNNQEFDLAKQKQ